MTFVSCLGGSLSEGLPWRHHRLPCLPLEGISVQTTMYLHILRYRDLHAHSKSEGGGLFSGKKRKALRSLTLRLPWQHPILPWAIYGKTTWESLPFSDPGAGASIGCRAWCHDTPNQNSKETSPRRHHQTQEMNHSLKIVTFTLFVIPRFQVNHMSCLRTGIPLAKPCIAFTSTVPHTVPGVVGIHK